jgi:HAMP domain-containing protein
MLDDFGEGKVTVNKAKLLTAIVVNRDKHLDTYTQASVAYRKAAIVELKKMLAAARNGRAIQRTIALVEPVHHLDEYNLALEMLAMSTKDEIGITQGQFKNFVQDRWDWSGRFAESTSRYVVGR